MKVLTKLITLVLATSIVTVSGVALARENIKDEPISRNDVSKIYTCSSNGFDLTVNKETLYFEISKNGKTWNSGKLDDEDTSTTSLRAAFFTSPVTLYYLTPNGGESNYSLNDENHAPYNKITFREKSNGFAATIKTFDGRKADPSLSVDFTLNVKLNDKGVDIYVSDLLENESKNRLSRIVLYPGFGSTYGLNNGYFLIPDGSGALIDLSKKTTAQAALKLKTYDYDYGISTNTRSFTASQILSLPMYAIQNNDAGFMAMVEGGQEFSELNSKVAGIGDNYNYSYFGFTYRDIYYSYQGISESTKKPVPQEEKNVFEPKISYQFFDREMTYSDYANAYQKYLVENNVLTKSNKLSSRSRLEYLLAENEPGLFGRSLVKMTSLDYVNSSVSSLLDEGNNFDVSLLGFSKGGLGNSYPNCFPVEPQLGSNNDFRNLATSLANKGVATSYTVDLVRVYPDSNVVSKDLAMNMSKKYITTPDYYFGTRTSFNRLTLGATKSYFNKAKSEVSSLSGTGIDFMSMGNALFSNHFNTITTRTDAMNFYKGLLDTYEGNVSLRKPNLYMFDSFDSYLAMPLESSHFMIETEDIPFLQMVLSGYKNMFVNSVNLNFTNNDIFLKMLENNVYPSFLLTEKDPINLKDSMSTNIYSSRFEDWSTSIKDSYNNVTKVLKDFVGAKFISHETIAPNVYKCTYNNGKSIIINYNNNDYSDTLVNVGAKGYKVIYE